MLLHFLRKKASHARKQQGETKRKDARAENMATVPAVVLALHEAELNTALIAPASKT